MPALTAIAKPRIVSFGLTWRESVIPAPTTGKDTPTNAATNIPAGQPQPRHEPADAPETSAFASATLRSRR
jgi:hypothetical protein